MVTSLIFLNKKYEKYQIYLHSCCKNCANKFDIFRFFNTKILKFMKIFYEKY